VIIAAMVLDPGSVARRILEHPLPQWFGQCSYSLYLVHMPLFRLLLIATPGGWPTRTVAANLWIVTALCVLFGVSSLTNRLVEKPCRELGRRIARRSIGERHPMRVVEPAA